MKNMMKTPKSGNLQNQVNQVNQVNQGSDIYELNLMGKTDVPCFYQIFLLRRSRFPGTFSYHDGYLYLIYEDEEKEEFYLEKRKVDSNCTVPKFIGSNVENVRANNYSPLPKT